MFIDSYGKIFSPVRHKWLIETLEEFQREIVDEREKAIVAIAEARERSWKRLVRLRR